MSGDANDWLLLGKEEVRAFLRNASDYKLHKWIKAGMTFAMENGEWTAYKGNQEEFFKAYTRRRVNLE